MSDNTDNTQGTSLQKVNSFAKGMVKDITDIYIPDGIWTNAINAINNTHAGDTGSIGNEQSNVYCTTVPYTIINITHKTKTEWVVCSTNNTDSEIGIFDEKDCSYRTIINDSCLNFSTFNLITGLVKENYDCTFSFYFQDNLNPDRVLNLDNVPFKCHQKTIEVEKIYRSTTITRNQPLNPCGTSMAPISGGNNTIVTKHNLGSSYGVVHVDYCTYVQKDRIQVWFDADPDVDPPTVDTGCVSTGVGGSGAGVAGVCPTCRCGNDETPARISFNKFTTTDFCHVKVIGNCTGNEPTTVWDYKVNCPVVTPDTPAQPQSTNQGVYYTDTTGVVQSLTLAYGQSITLCILEGSLVIEDLTQYTVADGETVCLTVNETQPDLSCDNLICTTDLDCDQLRLHPLVKQPCIELSKSKGSGQLNNGSYQVVIAYSENGIKLTDYSMPSNVQSLWDHSGLGGSLDISLDNLDQNFEEFEVVVISVTNQQAIAKKIGYYSINQTNIHLDLYNQSLPTVDLALVPLKSVVYEKSEKMFNVGGYLIRSGLTTQPYFNYQPFANKINVQWVAVEYPSNYYYEGGNKVGYLRDEVYPFFIRWVYNTGARSASFHIPGRKAIASDLAVVNTDDVINPDKNKTWQVYDTSTFSATTGTTSDGGRVVARGDMAYWESTELYPNDKKEIWGDLCNTPIRHHKMPSNETIHIHNNGGDKIYVLAVDFSNIAQPVDAAGNIITDIVGYEIFRGSREGNRSILAKGLFNNMVEYAIEGATTQKGLYQNYPFNDVNTDVFLKASNNIQYKKDILSFHAPENALVKPYIGSGGHVKMYVEELGIVNTTPEQSYKHPKFKFMNEDAFGAAAIVATGIALLQLFGKQSSSSTSTGHTDLQTTVIPWVTTAVGGSNTGESKKRLPEFSYDSSITTYSEGGTATVSGGILKTISNYTANGLRSGTVGEISLIAGLVFDIVSAIGSATLTFYQAFDQSLEIIYHFLSYRDYVLQLNSHGFYNDYDSVNNTSVYTGIKPSITRNILPASAKYISNGLQDYDSTYRINNINRNKYLAVHLEKDIPNVQHVDNSRSLVPDTNNALHTFQKVTSSYYGAIKYDYENQYGQLYSIVQLPTSSCVYDTTYNQSALFNSGPIFGGDVYINRYTEKNPFYFFNTWLVDVPNGTDWDYRNYVNGPQPEYWLDSTRYDASLFDINISWSNIIPQFNFNSPADYYSFHGKDNKGFGFRNAWMYLFNNGVRDFFTESELNIAYRDYGDEDYQKFYDPIGNSFTNMSLMFRSDLIKHPTYYKYDLSLSTSKLFTNFRSWSNLLPRDYDPKVYSTCFEYHPKKVVYSLRQQSGLKRDNWRNYLPLNYKDFGGKVTSIKALNVEGAIILFEDLEPIQFVGRDTFESKNGVKYTTGDGGLFMQNEQSIVNADDAFEYGTSISNRGVVNTPYGLFWMSQKTGKILSYNGSGIDEISKNGMKHWFLENLPSPLLKVYPEFALYDNIVKGIGCTVIFDSQYELLYFSKKDYAPTQAFLDIKDYLVYINGKGYFINETLRSNQTPITTCPAGYTYDALLERCVKVSTYSGCPSGYTYNSQTNMCEKDGESLEVICGTGCIELNGNCTCTSSADATYKPILIPIDIEDYLERIEWTVSYDPKIKAWISFHDWNPTFTIPSYDHFLTTKDNSFWRHNVSKNSYANFYGVDYSWEVEYPIVTPNNVTTLRSLEYTLEVLKYYNDGRDSFHVLDENFDRVVIYNSEQISGILKLTPKAKNNPLQMINYPVINFNNIDTLYSKEENKYRFNQFWDVTNDRGEFTGTNVPMWVTSKDGYKKVINPLYTNYLKVPTEHKKFRHYGNKIILRKNISGDKKMILKLTNSKHLNSPR